MKNRRMGNRFIPIVCTILSGILIFAGCSGDVGLRQERNLEKGWSTLVCDSQQLEYADFERLYAETDRWENVDVPHNWDDYGGYRRMVHGNLHGYAWYLRKFRLDKEMKGKQLFLRFEGVGSYARVWVNGRMAGMHAGGRTGFTLDITELVGTGGENLLVVRADHPPGIRDLPWVCGGCSPERGFSEGSQPFGIFRPVRLIATHPVRIEPFGVHVWNDENVSREEATIHIKTEVKNYGYAGGDFSLRSELKDGEGNTLRVQSTGFTLEQGETRRIEQSIPGLEDPALWSPEHPNLYRMVSEVREGHRVLDRETTVFGIRWIQWDIEGEGAGGRFYLNGEPVFINGTAEYEHLLGQSHAFTGEQVKARVEQVRAAGFNAFRDAHQPHNLRYHPNWDSLGILWWPQMAAHIWYDTPEFRENFKRLLEDWVKERRNSPSLILWGLENESTLPEDFARECTELIRQLDPTASSQRKVTTCNGGSGTDWNVVQNWSGTYGGDPWNYHRELARQWLNGEYGAWRSLGLHTEGPFVQEGPNSEDRMCLLMESKIRLAESVRDSCCGQFQWLFNSHDNPGRRQSGEGIRELDRLGPVNYKGLFTIWGEPTDAWYMYRANYVSPEFSPMLYIVSHTWPDRWTKPGRKDGIRIFSNCDSVELFNDVRSVSLGTRTRAGIGTHFTWDDADIRYNVLYAVGYHDGKEAASDCVLLHHLPEAPSIGKLKAGEDRKPGEGGKAGEDRKAGEDMKSGKDPGAGPQRNHLYRVNCGGPAYTDTRGMAWSGDVRKNSPGTWGSVSWTDDYMGLPPFYGSQRQTCDPIMGSGDWPLFQHFRYGRHKLAYEFPVPEGKYQVELFFIEPWYGTGGGLDCTGWRVFDVAVNDEIVLKGLDIWKEAGHDRVLKKTVMARARDGQIRISFPRVTSGQAIIAAIDISTDDMSAEPAPPSWGLISGLAAYNNGASGEWTVESWLDTGRKPYAGEHASFSRLTPLHFGAEWIRTPSRVPGTGTDILARFMLTRDATVLIGMDERIPGLPGWLQDYEDTREVICLTFEDGTRQRVYRKHFSGGDTVVLGANPGDGDAFFPMYSIAVAEHSSLDDAIDLRPVNTYQAEDAKPVGMAGPGRALDRECMMLARKGDAIEWEFRVGLASRYGLEFRYMNRSGRDAGMIMRIMSADGTEYRRERINLPATPGRWQSLRTDTGTTLNAGTWKIMLSLPEHGDICFDWLRVQ